MIELRVHGNPFPGLRPFGENEEHLFFGREEQIDELLGRLRRRRLIAVVGTSGSGKSSLVRAGMLPALYGGFMAGAGSAWHIATMRPGNHPVAELANALDDAGIFGSDDDPQLRRNVGRAILERGALGLVDAVRQSHVGADDNVLIVVDQFEELFRFSHGNLDDAAAFVKLLLEATAYPGLPLYVVLTMRSDFLGDCAQFRDLPERINDGLFLIPRMRRQQLQRAISGPVGVAGAQMAPRLVNRLLNDVGDEPDQLPALQHSLMRTWDLWAAERVVDEPMDVRHYEATGRLAEALSRHAEEVYGELPDDRLRDVARRLFCALTELGSDNRGIRRPLAFGEARAITGATDEELRWVIEAFRAPGRSFLMPPHETDIDDDTVLDISHESFMRSWSRLDGWVRDEAQSAQTYRRLAGAAKLHGEGRSALWRDPDLAIAEEWRDRTQPNAAWAEHYASGLFHAAMQFLDAGIAARAAEVAEVERAREAAETAHRERLEHQAEVQRLRAESARQLARRTRRTAVAMAVVAVLAVVAGIWGVVEARSATRAKVAAQHQQAIAEKALADMKTANAERDASEKARAKALVAVEASEKRALTSAAIARREAAAAKTASATAEARRKEADAQRRVADVQRAEALRQRAAVFLKSGQQAFVEGHNDDAAVLLAAAYTATPGDAALRVLVGEALARLNLRRSSFHAHPQLVTSVAFSPRGNRIATAGDDESTKVWTRDGKLLYRFADQQDLITALAFDPRGRYLVTGGRDGSLKIRDLDGTNRSSARSPVVLHRSKSTDAHTRRVNAIRFGDDGRIATAGGVGVVRLWQANGTFDAEFGSKTATMNDVVFVPGSKRIAGASSDGSVSVWDPGSDKGVTSFSASSKAPMLHVAVSPDGSTIAAGAVDGTVVLYDLQAGRAIAERHDHQKSVSAIAFDARGGRLLSASEDGTAVVIDAASGDVRANLVATTAAETAAGAQAGVSAVLSAAFSPANGSVVTTYRDGTVRLWTADGDAISAVKGHDGAVNASSFAPDGTTFATAGGDGRVALWQVPQTLLPARDRHAGAVDVLTFDPSGRELLTASRDGTAALWSVGPTLVRLRILEHAPGTAWVTSARFSSDGTRILTTAGETAKVWHTQGRSSAPAATIHTTGPGMRFSSALFADANYDVVAAERDLEGASAANDGSRWLEWSPDGSHILTREANPLPMISDVQLEPRSHIVMAKTSGGYISYTRLADGHEVSRWYNAASYAVAPSANVNAIGTVDGYLNVRNATGTKLSNFAGHAGRVSAMAFSSDGRWLVSAGAGDLLAKVWDVRMHALHATLRGSRAEITSLAFAPRGEPFVMTASADGSARLWDRDRGYLLGSASMAGSSVGSATFTRDGRSAVLAAADGRLYLWPFASSVERPGRLAAEALRRAAFRTGNTELLLNQAREVLHEAASRMEAAR